MKNPSWYEDPPEDPPSFISIDNGFTFYDNEEPEPEDKDCDYWNHLDD